MVVMWASAVLMVNNYAHSERDSKCLAKVKPEV